MWQRRSGVAEATVDALTLYVSAAAVVLLADFFLHWEQQKGREKFEFCNWMGHMRCPGVSS
jgi:hypothetical protein